PTSFPYTPLFRSGDGSRGERDACDGARDLPAVYAAEPPPEEHEQRPRAGDVDHRGGERDPPDAEAVEGEVEDRVQEQVAERDRSRDPVGLEAEERAIEHEHRPVEDEAGAEGRE